MEEHAIIAIPRVTLEHLLVALAKGYQRQPMREVKHVTETLERLIAQQEHTDRRAPVA